MTTLATYRVAWPRQVTAEQLAACFRSLATTAGTPTVLEACGRRGRIDHQLRVPESRGAAVVRQLRTALPGLAIERDEGSTTPPLRRAVSLGLTTRRRPLDIDHLPDVTAAVLAALAAAGKDELIVLQWVLTDRLAPSPVASTGVTLHDESVVLAALRAPFQGPSPADADTRGALRRKQGEPGWRAIGRIAVQAASDGRSRQLISGVLAALRTTEAPGVQITARNSSLRSFTRFTGHGRVRLNLSELTAVSAWPVGDTADLPVASQRSRRLPAPHAVGHSGRVVGASTWPGKPRPIGISADDSLRHVHVLGPTGTGKSTLLVNLISQDIAAGRGAVVVDPKGDLIADVLDRIPTRRRNDVVLLDPTSDPVVACNPLAGDPATADLRADQLLNVLHGLYHANWGPRTSDILGAALLTLARVPGMSLPAVPLVLTNPGFRRRILDRSSDPLGVDSFWASFEAWSEAERTTAIAPVLNKLRPFLIRPNLRRIVGDPEPRFNIQSVFSGQMIFLVNLATGTIGEEAANLLGALVLTGIWQAARSRSALPAPERHPVNVYLDEFADYLALPISMADALAQARGLGVGFTLAHQHLGQLSPSMKAAVMANARSRICFQLAPDDARTIATTSTVLAADDFAGLGAYEFYAQLVSGNAVQPWCSGRSVAPTPAAAEPIGVRRHALERHGVPANEIDQRLTDLLIGGPPSEPTDIGPRPRRRGGSS